MKDLLCGETDGEFEGESPSVAIVRAVARRQGVPATEMPPMYEWIDPDVVDAFCESATDGRRRNGRLEFVYDGHTIAVDGADELTIAIEETPSPGSVTVEALDDSNHA